MKMKQRSVKIIMLASFTAPMALTCPAVGASSLSNQLSPSPRSANVYEDTTFSLTFDSIPKKAVVQSAFTMQIMIS